MLPALTMHEVFTLTPAPVIAPQTKNFVVGDVITIGDVQPGDVVEIAHSSYLVKSIIPDSTPRRGGYLVRLARCSDGYESLNHSLYLGKSVVLLNR